MTSQNPNPGKELATKVARVQAFLETNNLSALLIERHENIAWATAGQTEVRVANGFETGVAALLFTRTGRRYYLAPANEGPRLADEEFPGLGFEPALYPWQSGEVDTLVKQLAGGGRLAADLRGAAHGYQTVDMHALRSPLLPEELERLTTLGRLTANTTAAVLLSLEPGLREDEMTARLAAPLLEQGVFPSVLLIATDDRIRKYKHAVPRQGRLERYGMLNLCARKWGLVVSITRFVHFGPPPADLADNFHKVARINAHLLHAARPGVTAGELYDIALGAYLQAGSPREIDLHHQGGTAGYGEREWLIRPGGEERVANPEVIAFNPSLHGAKAEDTIVLRANGESHSLQNVTATPTLPVIEVEIEGNVYSSADLLVR